jgi:hypothetical protein
MYIPTPIAIAIVWFAILYIIRPIVEYFEAASEDNFSRNHVPQNPPRRGARRGGK